MPCIHSGSKWDSTYSDTVNFVCVRMSLAIIWSNALLVHKLSITAATTIITARQ